MSEPLDPEDLPELHTGELDPDTLDAYVADLEAHAEVLEVRVKGGAERRAHEGDVPLGAAITMLTKGLVVGVQLRYRFDGEFWCDTLMALGPGRVRIVRMEG